MPTLAIPDLFARRSIRAFTPQPLTEGEIRLLLEAAMAAPSAGNRKPWHFIAITDPAVRQALSANHPYAKMLPQAPLCIVPCGLPALGYPSVPEFWIQDVSAACESILLAATGMGLGGVWCGVYPIAERVADARRILHVPDEAIPFCYLVLGHPAEQKEPRTQYEEARIHHERW